MVQNVLHTVRTQPLGRVLVQQGLAERLRGGTEALLPDVLGQVRRHLERGARHIGPRLCGNQPVSGVHASRRWRGGRPDDSARTRRKILISTQARVSSFLACLRKARSSVSCFFFFFFFLRAAPVRRVARPKRTRRPQIPRPCIPARSSRRDRRPPFSTSRAPCSPAQKPP